MRTWPLIRCLWLLGLAPVWEPFAGTAQSPPAKPNILILFADDLGYWDLGVQGCTDIPTPNIDSIAKNGVRFTSGYVSASMCSPSRAGLLTGRSQSRFGHEINWDENTYSDTCGLPLTEKTIADQLRIAGYRTGLVGKWHLGESPQFYPTQRGFDEFYGFVGGFHSYTNFSGANNKMSWMPLERNGRTEPTTGYITTRFGEEAASFITRHKDRPWLLYVPFNAPHGPLEATPELLARFPDITDPNRKTYAAMVSALDDAVGTILARVRSEGLEDRTLIFFLNDNGGPLQSVNGSRNDPLRGKKAEMWEGGVRVPYFIQWKGVLPTNQSYHRPVSSLDILPTALAVAGATNTAPQPLDGVNLLPFLLGQQTGDPHEALYWRMKPRGISAIRRGDDKLVVQDTNVARLFNLAADIAETNELTGTQTNTAATLQQMYNAWEAPLPEPAWSTDGVVPGPLEIDLYNNSTNFQVLGTNFTLVVGIDTDGNYYPVSSSNVPAAVTFLASGLTTLPGMRQKTFTLRFTSPNNLPYEISSGPNGRIGMRGAGNPWRFDGTNEVARITADLSQIGPQRSLQLHSFSTVNNLTNFGTNWVIGLRNSSGVETLSGTNQTNLAAIAPRLNTGGTDYFDFRVANTNESAGGWGSLTFDFLLNPPYMQAATFSPLFADGGVLQRDTPVPVWGTAAPNDTITLNVRSQTLTTTSDASGRWRVVLAAEPAGGPSVLTVGGAKSISSSVSMFFGDVWLLAGQAGMARPLLSQTARFPSAVPAVPEAADNFDDVRLAVLAPVTDFSTARTNPVFSQAWSRWQSNQLSQVSAVGYFFTRALRSGLTNAGTSVPLGILQTGREGTRPEDWISSDALTSLQAGNPSLVLSADAGAFHRGTIAPLGDYAVRGVVWCGEAEDFSSLTRVQQHRLVLETLVASWRTQWNRPDLPFYFLQADPYGAYGRVPTEDLGARLRESQAALLSLSNTYLAPILDRGYQWDPDAPFRDTAGSRLARLVLGRSYGLPVISRGPTLQSVQVNGAEVTVTFSNVAAGLETRAVDSEPDAQETQSRFIPGTLTSTNFPPVSLSSNRLGGFALAGNDGVFRWATEARILSTNQVRLANRTDVPAPVYVRYAFQNYPRCNLFNSEGLPAEPFRTDSFAYGAAGGVNSTPVTSGLTNRRVSPSQASLPISLTGVFDDVEDGESPLALAISQNSNSNVVTATISNRILNLALPGPAGTSTVSVQATDTGGQSTTASFELTVAPTYQDWRQQYFTAAELANPAAEATLWGDLADPDQDGLANLLEYALALPPRQWNSVPNALQVWNDQGTIKVRYLRAKMLDPSVTVALEKRASLNALPSWAAETAAETTVPAGTDSEWREISVVPAGSPLFYRVTVRKL